MEVADCCIKRKEVEAADCCCQSVVSAGVPKGNGQSVGNGHSGYSHCPSACLRVHAVPRAATRGNAFFFFFSFKFF